VLIGQEVTEVRENHRFDEKRLERYLNDRSADLRGPLKVEQFAGGQSNPTFLLTIGGERFVMRKKSPMRGVERHRYSIFHYGLC
jgi:aminoglycoside phosphotransferase (APT) family kinase protein